MNVFSIKEKFKMNGLSLVDIKVNEIIFAVH